MKLFSTGIELTDGRTRPCKIRALRGRAEYEIAIHEGRKRQLRRMFEELKRRVVELRRIAIGSLTIGSLHEGKIRPLTQDELSRLKSEVGLR